jgi:hypothetical protein
LIELARVDGVAVAAGCRVTQKPTSERSFEFACHLIDEFRRRRPADDAERKICWQLLDAGTSLSANTSESHGAQTDGDWITKWRRIDPRRRSSVNGVWPRRCFQIGCGILSNPSCRFFHDGHKVADHAFRIARA